MCARTEHMTRDQGLMDFDLFKNVIDQYVGANPERARTEDTWLHHFGESLVHPDFGRFVRYAVDHGVHAALSINPIMLRPEIAAELLASGIYKLYISLDGHDNESFQKIRGLKNSYEKSRENLMAFLDMKKRMKSETRIVLSMIDFGLNRESIAKLRHYWESVPGIDEFLCKEFVTWDGNAAEVNRFREKATSNEELRTACGVVSCNVPWQTVTIAWDGDVVPCCFDYDKKYVLGNVGRESLAAIWNGEPMKNLRREFLSNDVKNPLCRNCSVLYADVSHTAISAG